MQRVFISNAEINERSIKINEKAKISDFMSEESEESKKISKDGDTVFVIDVHCRFKDKDKDFEKLQQQGGVRIYRHLLNVFKDCQDKLKVVFYSPISQADLVKLEPENYVLKLLPFIELFPLKKDSEGNWIDDEKWDFAEALGKFDQNYKFPQLNNASENLLSGWALCPNKEVKLNNKKVLFIDDQQGEWDEVFSYIFSKQKNQISFAIKDNGETLTSQQLIKEELKNNLPKLINILKNTVKIEKPALILSDFYLTENHEVTEWNDPKKIRSKSGNKVFNSLRTLIPATPYLFHTSSNKAKIYKFLDARGVDDWIVKDVRTFSPKNEKADNFLEFRDCLEKYLSSDIFQHLDALWNDIKRVEKSNNLWWEKKFGNFHESIVEILHESWFALRRLTRKQTLFEKSISSQNRMGNDDVFTTSAVINSMGKIIELLEFNKKATNLRRDTYLPNDVGLSNIIGSMRNTTSHGRKDMNCVSIMDGILTFYLTLEILKQTGTRDDLKKIYPLPPNIKLHESKGKPLLKFAIFWLYIQLHNSNYLQKYLSKHNQVIENRIDEIFHKFAKTDAKFKDDLDKHFNHLKKPDQNARKPNLVKDSKGKYVILSR